MSRKFQQKFPVLYSISCNTGLSPEALASVGIAGFSQYRLDPRHRTLNLVLWYDKDEMDRAATP